MPIELTDKYLRIRVKNPKRFSKIRTDDIGRKGHSMRLAGYNPKTAKWETQAWLVDRKGIKNKDIRTLLLLHSIAKELPIMKKALLRQRIRKLT